MVIKDQIFKADLQYLNVGDYHSNKIIYHAKKINCDESILKIWLKSESELNISESG